MKDFDALWPKKPMVAEAVSDDHMPLGEKVRIFGLACLENGKLPVTSVIGLIQKNCPPGMLGMQDGTTSYANLPRNDCIKTFL